MPPTGSVDFPTVNQMQSWRHPQASVSVGEGTDQEGRVALKVAREGLQKAPEEGPRAPSGSDNGRSKTTKCGLF